ncbi:MAG: MATE family efflux transporter [Bacteroidales bacterium]|nr:MATE family efflux transporter [Bacteroidales bacterium]
MIKFRRIWRIAYPIVIGNIAQNLLGITDTAFIGRLDAVALGAAALGNVFYIAVMMLGFGFSIGIQIIVARRYAEGRYSDVGNVLHHALLFLAPFALLIFILLKISNKEILPLLIQSPEVLASTSGFIDMRILGILFGYIIYVFQAFLIGIARTKLISYVTILMVAVNILFDWALIFGYAGFEAMGVEGAALASVISEISAVFVYAIYIYRKKTMRIYRIFSSIHYSMRMMLQLLKISFPASLQNFLSVASWFIFFIMVEKLGEEALAVSNIGRSIYMLYLIPLWGFSSAVNSLVSYSIGCRKPMLIYPIMGKVVLLTAVSILLLELLSFLFSGTVMSIYTNIPELQELTLHIMPTMCLSALGFGVGFICFNTVSGTGNTHISLYIEMIATCVYLAITILAVESWRWGIVWVWLVDGIYGLFMMLAALIYLKTGKWMNRKV